MSDALTITDEEPAAKVRTDAHFEPLSRKQRALVESMVWDGRSHQEAGVALGIPDSTSRRWMRSPVIRAALKAEEVVLRQQARSGNVRALVEIRDKSKNQLARVQAIKTIEDLANEGNGQGGGPGRAPGYVIVINQAPQASPQITSQQQAQAKPLIDITPVAVVECNTAEQASPAPAPSRFRFRPAPATDDDDVGGGA